MEDILKLVYELNRSIITAQNFLDIERKIAKILSKKITFEWMEIWIIKEDEVSVYGKEKHVPLADTPVEYLIKTASIFY